MRQTSVSSTWKGRPRRLIVPGNTNGVSTRIDVPELFVQEPGGSVAFLADTGADSVPPPHTGLLFGGIGELSRDPAAPVFGQHECVLDLGEAQVCPPGDVDVPDGLIVLPGDEVRGSLLDLLAQAVERQ